VDVGHTVPLEYPGAFKLDLFGTEMVEQTTPLAEEHGDEMEFELVQKASSSQIWSSTPARRAELPLWSASAPAENHACRRCPPSPSALPGPSFGRRRTRRGTSTCKARLRTWSFACRASVISFLADHGDWWIPTPTTNNDGRFDSPPRMTLR
jgi:hypothetical protein